MKNSQPKSRGFHFDSLASLCKSLDATKVSKRLLVANNGLAAVKGIDSIRSWLYEHTGDPEAVQFVVMATPEDLKANAEFISLADHHVPVPGGPNGNNYANVDLIMHTALQNTCDAIYPGWGHASENPALPRECDKSKRVTFLGPSEEAMFALGDKIASTIVAQSNGVPTVPWSGDSIRLPPGCFDVDAVTYDKAYVTSPEECEEVCRRIGFPVMIKASEGGGGKGIRCCSSINEVKDMFFAVSEEVKGCHIFVMRMLGNVRHLEVQLLADNYDNCIAVRTRDCSVQRRHQKIIEEGPAFDVDPSIIAKMEQAAIRLAKAVKYRGLGTVEYMYDKQTHDFYFLELNPRIQVEHPVSELISGVNLPAALFCVGMGIHLDRIPEVRGFYGENPYETTPIDFEHRESLPAKGHTIAVRVTAEDTDEGFRPTSGKVDEISFKNSKECWGYFSVGSGGAIHQFADSQFGHIFSSGDTREEARRGMVLALRNLVIRGEIRTSSSYVLDLLETQAFRDCDVSTAWLDGLIAKRNEEAPNQRSVHNALIAACIYRGLRSLHEDTEKYISFLTAGHVPSTEYLENDHTESYVSRGEKYTVRAGKISASEYAISLNGSIIVVPYRILKSGALQLSIGSKTLVAYVTEEPNSLRITIGGKVTNFTGDLDPTKILATVPGRLVRYVIENDGHVNEGGTFAEIEVMKMILPLRASTTGVLHCRAIPGSTVSMGILLAEITPDDPSKVARPFDIKDSWPAELLIDKKFERPDSATRARRALETLYNMLCGYHFKEMSIEERIRGALEDMSSLFLSSVSLKSMHAPFLPDLDESTTDDAPETPNEKLQVIFDALIERYLKVERPFDDRTRQEAIELMRSQVESDSEVYEMDFAHNQECHVAVIKGILNYLDGNNVLLKTMKTSLSKLVGLQSYAYGSLLLQTRYLLRQCSLPSFTERKTLFAKELEEGSLPKLLRGSYGNDLICSVMFDRQMSHLIQICLELFIRREHFGDSHIKDLDIFRSGSSWYATYSYEPLSHDEVLAVDDVEGTNHLTDTSGSGICLVFPDEQLLRNSLPTAFREVLAQSARDTSVCTIFFCALRDASQEEVTQLCFRVLEENKDSLIFHETIETIYFIVHGMAEGPHIFTFSKQLNFREETLLRNVLPQSARRLELDRLANYDVSMYPTPFKDVHVFKGTPKKQGASHLENRMFARVAVTPHDMGMAPWSEGTDVDAGHMLGKCLAALEVARDDVKVKYPPSNHVFVKMIELTFDVSELKRLLVAAASSYQQRLIALGVTEVELSFQVKLAEGLIPMRVTVNSPSGFGISVHIYYESIENGVAYLHRAETSEDVALSTRSMSSDYLVEMASPATPSGRAAPNSLKMKAISKLEALREMLPSHHKEEEAADGVAGTDAAQQKMVLGPYPQLNQNQVKRLQARAANTTYALDWPALLNLIVRKDWSVMRRVKNIQAKEVPSRIFHATQLFLAEDGATLTHHAHQKKQSSGMLVWLVDYAPARYFDEKTRSAHKRKFVMVANDITFQSGSFAVPEDVVFAAACELARAEHLPFVYISANSGARLGLSNDVKKRFMVEFTANNEIDYLYLKEADLKELERQQIQMDTTELVVGDEKRYVLNGIVGGPSEYMGVENLSGSGLVAGQMSKNYSTIPTISVVSGRSVGIGAYLNRLGRRVIQTNDAPLILTGASALNRLLGKDVYSDNSQLGGRQIMVPNGVTHWSTKNDYGSARTLMRWLDYVPPVVHPLRCTPRVLTSTVEDPVNRDVTFTPEPNTPYDPRFLVTGVMDRTGLFDRGSWTESLDGWAKTVVSGRATLGGIPCGVILVETRLTKKFNPADPADPTSASSFTTQAGQVWFPDSARKTADSLDDFHHERLPCFIFANWRGFSGGMRDMYDEVLKFGASIVDNLRVYTAPVFIYIPPFGELRGGAWVVVDPVINHNNVVEMYCDPTSRGGILEPSGVAEIKFRDNDVRELIRRCRPDLTTMEPKKAREEEGDLLPRFRDVAVRFADLHDTYVRMKAKGVVRDVIPWKDSRRIFHVKLTRKLAELDAANTVLEAGKASSLAEAVTKVQQSYSAECPNGPAWGTADAEHLKWLEAAKKSKKFAADSGRAKEAPKAHPVGSVDEMREVLKKMKENGGNIRDCFAELFADDDISEAALSALPAVHSLADSTNPEPETKEKPSKK